MSARADPRRGASSWLSMIMGYLVGRGLPRRL